MKVVNINPILFKGTKKVTKPEQDNKNNKQIKELSNVTPDFAVNIPNNYKKIGEDKLYNGLTAYSYKLGNGHRVTIVPMEGSPSIVKNYVNVGSLNETDDIKGISHFLEHMAFNGTNGNNGYEKLSVGDSFNRIDKLGGWINASTNYAVTDYVNSSPMLENTDLEEQIKIIAAMTEDLALTDEMIEKEKGPVCSEINMIMDSPMTIALDQTMRTLFNIKSSADELVGGSVQHIKNLNREKVKAYYDKYYTPDNMNLVITGDVDPQETIELVAKHFKSKKTKQDRYYQEKMTPINKTVRKDFITDKAKSTSIILGFTGPENNNTKDKMIFEIVSSYLMNTDVGLTKELKKLNSYPEIGLEKVSNNPNNSTLLYCGLECSDENSEKALKIIFDKLSNIKKPTEKELDIIKERILQYNKSYMEYSSVVNNAIGSSILNDNLKSLIDTEDIINSITADDIEHFIKKYFNLNKAAITLVHPEVSFETINSNYENASKLSFKGNKRLPINTDKVSQVDLENNYKMVFYTTSNDDITFRINHYFDGLDKNINPVIGLVLDEIYSMGTKNINEDEFNKFTEDNNIGIGTNITSNEFSYTCYAPFNKFEKTLDKTIELMYEPRIKQEEFNIAVERIKDSLSRREDSADSIYIDYETANNPFYYSKQKILDNLDKIKLEDVQKQHEYLLNNSSGIISINIPEKHPEFKNYTINKFSELATVKKYKHNIPKIYKENTKPVVLTKEKPVSQAEIMQLYKFPKDGTLKESLVKNITNTLLSSSKSIGLFNTLREKEHLAYSVYSSIDSSGDTYELSCNILTTTDNKDIGEFSYDNVQKSIKGFHRQINELKNSKYTDEDLESAKRMLKANLLDKEGTASKLAAIHFGIELEQGIDYYNNLYKEIDSITREDIQKFVDKAFVNPPIYSIVASKDTLEANKDFLESLKN